MIHGLRTTDSFTQLISQTDPNSLKKSTECPALFNSWCTIAMYDDRTSIFFVPKTIET